MGQVRDLTGMVFGRLTVDHRVDDYISPSGKSRATRWHAVCECGNECDVVGSRLLLGQTKSCGCNRVNNHANVHDLTGKQFGRLTVLYRSDDRVSKSGAKKVMWHCKCECGNECNVEAYALSAGKTLSCGCYKREATSRRKLHDLVGQRFGRLVVIARSDDYITPNTGARHTRWHCRCDCGNECDVVAISLIKGDTTSCGCYFRERTSTRRFIDLTGKRFGRLVVLGLSQDEYIAASGYRVYKWSCQCDCGAVVSVFGATLRNGRTTSCGCYARELASEKYTHDLTGQRFGQLLVLYKSDNYYISPDGQRQVRWHVKCDCGNEIDVVGHVLRRGVVSCGCVSSRLEYDVIQYFNICGYKSGIDYESQKRYNDLTGIGGGKLRYDFLVYRKEQPYCLIECQGEQHYRSFDYFGGDERFEIQQFHDELKAEYAASIGIPLVEIPYTADTYEKVVAILQEHGI